MNEQAIRELFDEIVTEWIQADSALDQEYLVGEGEYRRAETKRAETVAEWEARLWAALPETPGSPPDVSHHTSRNIAVGDGVEGA